MARHLWPGMNVGLGGDDKNVDEVINQVMITRGMLPQSKGAVHWSIAALITHEKLRKGLLDGPYKNQAIVPPSAWLDNKKPQKPIVTVVPNGSLLNIQFNHPNVSDVFRWVVYTKYGDKWSYRILNKKDKFLAVNTSIETTNGKGKNLLTAFAVTAIDRTGNESDFFEYKMGEPQ